MTPTGNTRKTGYGECTEYTTDAARPAIAGAGPGLSQLGLDIDPALSGLAWIIGGNWEAMVTLHDGAATFSSILGGIQDRA